MTIQELLKDHQIEFAEVGQHHHARDGWIQIRNCPYCGSQNFHLGFNLRGNYFVCWRCGSHYAPQVFDRLGIDRKSVAELFPYFRDDKQTSLQKNFKLVEPKGLLPLSECKAHRKYLISRRLSPSTIASIWHVQGIKIASKLSWRLYIPVFQKGEQVSWTTRAIGKVNQRYISAPKNQESVNIKKVVYGADLCGHTVVICEGPVDAWAIGPGAVALFGTAFTSAQIKRLAEFPYRFVCFDSSPDAQLKAKTLCVLLSVFPGATQNIVLDAKDPAESNSQELSRLRRATKLG